MENDRRFKDFREIFLNTGITLFILVLFFTLFQVETKAATIAAGVTKASSGNVLVGVEGSYSSETKETILKRINAIRKEACREGVKNPVTGRALTMADYVPLKWSQSLEVVAQLRAAESTVCEAHTRPNNSYCFSVSYNKVSSEAENLAWNYYGMMYGIEQWYREKSAWVNQTGASSGHYQILISPSYRYIGMGMFQKKTGGWNGIAAELSSTTSKLSESRTGYSGACTRVMEVSKSKLSSMAIKGKQKMSVGKSASFSVTATAGYTAILGGTTQTSVSLRSGVTWKSSNPKVATVSSTGKVKALSKGKTRITAKVNSFKKVTFTVTVG